MILMFECAAASGVPLVMLMQKTPCSATKGLPPVDKLSVTVPLTTLLAAENLHELRNLLGRRWIGDGNGWVIGVGRPLLQEEQYLREARNKMNRYGVCE